MDYISVRVEIEALAPQRRPYLRVLVSTIQPLLVKLFHTIVPTEYSLLFTHCQLKFE